MRGTYKNPTEDALGIGSDLASPAPGGTGASPAPGGTGPTQFRLYERTYPPEGGERRSPTGIVRSYLTRLRTTRTPDSISTIDKSLYCLVATLI